MHFSKFLATLAVIPAVVLSLPAPIDTVTPSLEPRHSSSSFDVDDIIIEKRQSCAATCGSVCYYQSTIDNAVSTGYGDYKSGDAPGGYPHTYNNYEGFDFGTSGPYQEFPVLKSFKPYTGGSPGPDRVIFNTRGQLAGVITHTGASGNNFVACEGGV